MYILGDYDSSAKREKGHQESDSTIHWSNLLENGPYCRHQPNRQEHPIYLLQAQGLKPIQQAQNVVYKGPLPQGVENLHPGTPHVDQTRRPRDRCQVHVMGPIACWQVFGVLGQAMQIQTLLCVHAIQKFIPKCWRGRDRGNFQVKVEAPPQTTRVSQDSY
jgi:hypothetical protein